MYLRIIFCILWLAGLQSCQKQKPLFTLMHASETGIHFKNQIVETDSFHFFNYQYIYNGAGVAVADFDKDGWEDIFFTSNTAGANKLYKNLGNWRFKDITTQAGVAGKSQWCTGASVADVNADGWPDIYVSTVHINGVLTSQNELYINNQKGGFTEQASHYGLALQGHTTQSVFFDYDRDGDLDCWILNHAIEYSGDAKTAATRARRDSLSGERLLQNVNGHFTDVSEAAGLIGSALTYGLGIVVSDLNMDGWPDVYMSNDFKENDYCYINLGNGRFSEQSARLFGHQSRFSMGCDAADVNQDGWPDVMSLDMLSQEEKVLKSSVSDDDLDVYNYKQLQGFHHQFSRNCLQINRSGRYFSDLALQTGVAATDWSWAPLLADYNNDGLTDLFVTNGYKYRANDLDFNVYAQQMAGEAGQAGRALDKLALIKQMPAGQVHNYLYLQNAGDFTFADASFGEAFTTPNLSNGAAYADFDNDGDLDLVANCIDAGAALCHNTGSKGNAVQILLKGSGANTAGIGAKIYAYAGGKLHMIEQSPVRGFMSTVSTKMHIGIGQATQLDSLVICWPAGTIERRYGLAANQTITLAESSAGKGYMPILPADFLAQWQPDTAAVPMAMHHHEDDFEDLNVQPLLPHSMATAGPALAHADVDGDGREDLFLGGAQGHASTLFLQQNDGKFMASPQAVWLADAGFEPTDALFFDADGDADPDLFLCAGGNRYYGRNESLYDRLYLNDGKGGFSAGGTIPGLTENKGAVAAADVDKDGKADLFVGGRVNARMYGYTPASVLLRNAGKAQFEDVTTAWAPELSAAGMITDALFTDVNADGWPDLLVVGEWMPITLFINQKGRLQKAEMPGLAQTNGLWNCLLATDVDGDGDDDFLAGNWGLNAKLTATARHPLTLFLADWDKNGETDPVLSIYKQENYYPFLGKQELEKRIPIIRKKYARYTEMAGKTVAEIFGGEALSKARKLEAFTLQSSIVWNHGGKLQTQALPAFLQQAPIFAFATVPAGHSQPRQWLAAGNFYDASPYEGRYDALLPTLFQYSPQQQMQFLGYLPATGQVRALHAMNLGNKPALVLAPNNAPVQIFTAKNTQP